LPIVGANLVFALQAASSTRRSQGSPYKGLSQLKAAIVSTDTLTPMGKPQLCWGLAKLPGPGSENSLRAMNRTPAHSQETVPERLRRNLRITRQNLTGIDNNDHISCSDKRLQNSSRGLSQSPKPPEGRKQRARRRYPTEQPQGALGKESCRGGFAVNRFERSRW